jgi:hypothetical protein
LLGFWTLTLLQSRTVTSWVTIVHQLVRPGEFWPRSFMTGRIPIRVELVTVRSNLRVNEAVQAADDAPNFSELFAPHFQRLLVE